MTARPQLVPLDEADRQAAEAVRDEKTSARAEKMRARTLPELFEEIDRVGEVPPIPTAFDPLNKEIGGYPPGCLTVFGGSTGHGKSTVMRFDALFQGTRRPVLFWSLEDSALFVARLMRKTLGLNEPPPENLHIWDGSTVLADGLERIGLFAEEHDSGETPIVFVDHLGRISNPGAQNREREVAGAVEGFSELAKKTGIVIVAAVQLNRSVDTDRGDRKPKLKHFRESGTIEQAARLALLLQKEASDRISINVGKNTFGPSEMTVELSADYASGYLGALTPQQAYSGMVSRVCEFLATQEGRTAPNKVIKDKVYDSGGKVTKARLEQAAKVFPHRIRVEGSRTVLVEGAGS